MNKLIKKEDIFGGLSAGAFTLGILLLSFAVGGMFPFGSGTLSWCDMNQQIIPLFCNFKDVLSGEASFFYSTANAGGMNFYGVYFFFLSSPFTYLVAFVSKADIPYLMNILVILKLTVAGFTAGLVIKKLSHRLNCGTVAALGCSYAVCGYSMMYYQNIMWLDIMYVFPLVVWGIFRITKHNRPLVLTFSLIATVFLNFYLSFMVYLFVILFFGVFALVYKHAKKKLYSNLALSGFISLVCSAVVWLPCFLQYIDSARGGSGISDLINTSFFAPVETTLPLLLGSGLIFAVLIFIIPRFSELGRETKLLLYGFILTAVPLILEPINKMWHLGSYMSFPARFGFIPVFLGILLVANVLNSESNEKSHKIATVASLVTLFPPFLGLLISHHNNNIISAFVITLWGNNASLKILGIVALLFIGSYLFLFFLKRKKFISNRFAAIIICVIVAVECFCSVQSYIFPAKTKLDIEQYRQVLALSEEADKEGFYRVGSTHKITHANMFGAAGFNSISHYTSLNNREFMLSAKRLGYSGYWMETGNWGGNILSDALLNVGYTASYTGDGYTLEENPYYLGLGVYSKSTLPSATDDCDRLLSVGDAFGKLTGSKNSVEKYEPFALTGCSLTENKGTVKIHPDSDTCSIAYSIKVADPKTLYFDCYGGFSTNLVEAVNNSFDVFVNGEKLSEAFPTQSFNGLLELGHFENQTVNITLVPLKAVSCISFGVFSVDENTVKEAIANTECTDLKEKNGGYYGKVKKGKLFLSIPKASSLHIKLDGKYLSSEKVLNCFYEIDIPTDGNLEIEFRPQGLVPGIFLSIAGVGFLVWFILHLKAKKNYFEKLYSVMYGIFLGGCTTAFIVIYILPMVLSLMDFVP